MANLYERLRAVAADLQHGAQLASSRTYAEKLEAQAATVEEAIGVISKGNAWVSTAERQPAFDQTVLGFWPATRHCAASYESITFYEGDDGGPDFWLDVFAQQEDEPTHWMPLPEAPK